MIIMNHIFANNYIQQFMEEQEIDQDKPSRQEIEGRDSDIVSIRKKLAAPNDILPGLMIRSQHPIHLLPVQHDFQTQPGHQMMLAEVTSDQIDDHNDQNMNKRSKNVVIKTRSTRSKSEFSNQKGKQKVDLALSIYVKNKEPDSLQFLSSSLKSILSFPQQIEFISKTALLGNLNEHSLKTKFKNCRENGQINQLYMKYLSTLNYFGVTTYAYDQFKPEETDVIPSYKSHGDDLQFFDDFQSSNLYLAMRCNQSLMMKYRRQGEKFDKVYLTTVRLDYNTKSYGQWFYFKVKRKQNVFSFSREHQNSNFYKFMIVNMTKSLSMFGKGLKISVCRKGVWRKEGLDIRYSKNLLTREDFISGDPSLLTSFRQKQSFYTLEFTLQIFEGEQLYISYNQPYTYTRIGRMLDLMTSTYESNKRNIIDIKRHVICQTFLNNNIEVINLSAKTTESESIVPEQKKVIFIMGRCHPVETAGSHVAEGILNSLCSLFIETPLEEQKNHIIYKLLQNYVLKIIPMTNPDGVILGNSRCNIAGYDLNRSWRSTKLDRCKEIFQIKRYILQYQNRIAMFLDLHAHSKKKNVFAYGCHDMSDPFSTREFPFLLSKLSENDFLFSQCRFTRLTGRDSNQKGSKEGTARVFLYDVLRIPNVFTIENSYCSAKNSVFHYDKASYDLIGGDILRAISLYFSPTFRSSQQWRTDKQTFFSQFQSPVSQMILRDYGSTSERSKQILNISLNETMNEIQLKVKVHKSDFKMTNIRGLRQQILHQLRKNEENITIGLMKDEVSDSEEEERVYEVTKKIHQKSDSISPRRKKQISKITEKLGTFLTRTKTVGDAIKQHSPPDSKTLRNALSTHSSINLVKVASTSRHNRFHPLNKIQELGFQPLTDERAKMESLSKANSRHKRNLDDTIYRSTKKDKFLSVVEIGLEGETNITHNYKFNLAQRMENKFPITNTQEESSQREKGLRFEPQLYINHKKQAEIKDYLRRLVRPKQLLERRQRVPVRSDKQEKKEIRLKPSILEFSEGRLTRLLANQGAYSRILTEHVGI